LKLRIFVSENFVSYFHLRYFQNNCWEVFFLNTLKLNLMNFKIHQSDNSSHICELILIGNKWWRYFFIVLVSKSDFLNFYGQYILFDFTTKKVRFCFSPWMLWRNTMRTFIWLFIKLHQLVDSFELICFFCDLIFPFLKLFQCLTWKMTKLLRTYQFQKKLSLFFLVRLWPR